MSIPTNEQILRLLSGLDAGTADDLETQFVEFKPWRDPKQELRVAVEYAAYLANAEGGVIVFGVADRIRGRDAAITGAGGYDADVWKRGIFDATRPNLSVRVEELAVPEGTGKLLVVRVPKGSDPPYGTAQGLYKRRVGKNCMPLDPAAFTRIRVGTGTVDWSAEPARGVSVSDLDPVEIARARNILRRLHSESELLELGDEAFLAGLGALRGGQVTHTGLLLFGRETVLVERCPQHQLHYVYQVSDTEVARNDAYRCGLLQALERIETIFSGPVNPEKELSVGFFKLRVPAFPPEVVREAVLNAVTHRDYSDPGEVFIRHRANELVVVSPGGFLAGITPQNILRHEPISRNRILSEAFQKLRLVERAGVGRRRIFIPMLEYGKQIPTYETDGQRVILRIRNGALDAQMAKRVAKWKQKGHTLDLETLLILSLIHEHGSVDPLAASRLLAVSRREAETLLGRLAYSNGGFLKSQTDGSSMTYHLDPGAFDDAGVSESEPQTRRPTDSQIAKGDLPRLRLDRDHQKSLAAKHVAELVRSDSRRVMALVAYAAPGNSIEALVSQFREHFESALSDFLEIKWLSPAFPSQRSRLRRGLEEELRRLLGADSVKPVAHLLRRYSSATKGRQSVLWLDWGTFGKGHQEPLKPAQLTEWLRFSSEFLVTQFPDDLRAVSFLAIETEASRHARLAQTFQEHRRQPWCRRREFRLSVLPPLDRVSEEDLLDFFDDPRNSSCEPSISTEVAERLIVETGGEFEATVTLMSEAERSSWYDLVTRLRRSQGEETSMEDEEPF